MYSLIQYNEYNEVVVEHRLLKEKQRLKVEQEERERKAAAKVPPLHCSATIIRNAPLLLIVVTGLVEGHDGAQAAGALCQEEKGQKREEGKEREKRQKGEKEKELTHKLETVYCVCVCAYFSCVLWLCELLDDIIMIMSK